jgi:hypothetical protein
MAPPSTNVTTRKRTRKSGSSRSKQSSTRSEVAKFAGDAYSLAERAYKGVSHVLKLINIETKFYDYGFATTLANADQVTYLSDIPQGVTQKDRISWSVKLQLIEIRLTLTMSTSFSGPGWVRIFCIRDLENAGSAPTLAQYLDTASFTKDVALPLVVNKNRFAVLFDEMVQLDSVANRTFATRFTIPHNGHIKFRADASGVASAAEGAIFWGSYSSMATNLVSCAFSARLWYTDD